MCEFKQCAGICHMKKKENEKFTQMTLFDQAFLKRNENVQGEDDFAGNALSDGEDDFVREVTSMELPMDWENFYESDPGVKKTHVQSISEGFVKCLNEKGCVDIEYISAITGEDFKTVIEKLQGAIYQNPDTWGDCFFRGWETAEEYLSGNIRQKLKSAKDADQLYHGYFSKNVKALSELLPKTVSSDEIYVTVGSPWIPTDVIEDFLMEATGTGTRLTKVKHDEKTGTWEWGGVTGMGTRRLDFKHKYGTSSWKPDDLLLRTLNMQSVAVFDTIKSDYTKTGIKKILNKEETVLALEKQKALIRDFKAWIWKDKARKKRLETIYEEKYCSIKSRHYDGSFLEFPQMNPEIALYPYQKDAVARILFSPNTLLAHDVGSGKTLVMIAAGMEMKRMNLSKRNMYVVPNNLVGQWKAFFYELYPGARVKCVDPKSFAPDRREAELRDVRDGDYDAIIIAYSCFSRIPISKAFQIEEMKRELEECRNMRNYNSRKATRRLSDKITKLSEKIMDVTVEKEEEGICFDELGITRLFVDEAHNFKNVPVETKIEMVMGINKAGSVKCKDMLSKVRLVQHQNGGKGVIFATGTPITNSITDAFIMQQYLQSGELALLELQNFDSWVGMFAEQSTNFEIDVDTSNYRLATRFSKFHNIPELTAMLSSIADFHQMDETAGVPEHEGYQDVTVPRTKNFADYLQIISRRADDVRGGRVSRADDNMLKITTDGRKAALDIRLIDEKYGFTTSSKVFQCAEKVAEVYRQTADRLGTQLIFCDTSTPKTGFNVYDELKGLLVRMGVPEGEIAYIHSATTEPKREKLFANVRSGKIRVLLGSTFKLGLGVNVQDRLIALHHLDVPWRPADMSQREGRILRQGNQNEKVWIYRYITEGSFDAYSWQLLETKARFIAELLAGTVTDREGGDIDETVLNYAEVKALAVGNPLIRERVEAANELSKYSVLQRKAVAQRESYGKELQEIPEKLRKMEEAIPKVKADVDHYMAHHREYSEEERRTIRKTIHQATCGDEPTKEESVVVTYQGFDVVVPENISAIHPVVYLKREYSYFLDLGSSEIGGLMRIDNFLERLPAEYESLCRRAEEHKRREEFLKTALKKEVSYLEQIETYQKKVAELDRLLGVDKAKE